VKDPNAPKRAKTAYLCFVSESRESLKKANPTLTFGELGRLLGEQWRAVSEEERKKYEAIAEEDRKRYHREKEEYQSKMPK